MKSFWLIATLLLLPNYFCTAGTSIEPTPTNQATFPIPVCGLPNVGNSCYMNASLQCLFRIPEIACLVQTASSDDLFLWQCKKIINAQEKTGAAEAIFINTAELFDQVNRQLFHSFDKQQEDALEFIVRFIESTPSFQPLFGISLNTTIYCTQCNKILRSANQTIYDLRLDALKPQIISGMLCPNCSHTSARKELKLNNYPPYLLVDCKNNKYASTHIEYFDLNDSSFPGYTLIGAVLHAGTEQCGHYIASVKELSTQQWYLCNDINVINIGHKPTQQNKHSIFLPRLLLYAKTS